MQEYFFLQDEILCPSFSRGIKLQRCSGFKPLAYEDPNMVTKCQGSKHNYT